MRTLKELVEGILDLEDLEKVAIVDRREYRSFEYSYEELYDLALRFACFLRGRGLKKGDKVMIWSPNGIEYVVTLFGAFLEGVVVVPIDVKSGVDFVEKIQKQVGAKLIVQTRYNPILANAKIGGGRWPVAGGRKGLVRQDLTKGVGIETVFTERLLNILEDVEVKKSDVKVVEGDVAEINYTSGTTGEPKGVVLTHKNIMSNVNSLSDMGQMEARFKMLSVLPLSHMFEQTIGLFLPIISGASVAHVKTLKLSSLFEAFKEERPTHTIVVPRLLQLIYSGVLREVRERGKEAQFSFALKMSKRLPRVLKRIVFSRIHKSLGDNLEYFICGGSTLDPKLEKFYEAIGLPIVQGYGLTETSPVLTNNKIEERKFGSVGKAVPGVKIRLNKGDVLTRGDNVTSGYYKNPKKTREVFVDGWFKTGDIGSLDDDGFLFLRGRRKDMIVTGEGVNVYPEDIEGVLNAMAGVRDSCVIGFKSEKGEEIRAVLLLEDGVDKKVAGGLISEANKKLEEAKRIKDYSIWDGDDFPRTTTMKIKKFAVKESLGKVKVNGTSSGNKVYDIISRLTSKKVVSGSTLQDLGLSSIDRVELISLLERGFGVEIDEEVIVSGTSVKDIEGIVRERKKVEKKSVFKKWALWPLVRAVRFVLQQVIVLPFSFRIFCRMKVEGKENLKGLKSPVIFTSNHQSHYDGGVILSGLPLKWSQNLAMAAWREYFFNPDLSFKSFFKRVLFYFGLIVFNTYSFPVEKGYRGSMKYTGSLIGKGWNILVFPEGMRTRTGKIGKFKRGIGMMAVEMGVPIVPVKIEGAADVFPIGKFWPRFGRVIMKIGKPIEIKTDSYIEATNLIEKAVRKL